MTSIFVNGARAVARIQRHRRHRRPGSWPSALLRMAAVLLGLGALNAPAMAAPCTYSDTGVQTVAMWSVEPASPIAVPRDFAASQIVYDTGWQTAPSRTVTCSNGSGQISYTPSGSLQLASGYTNVFATSVPGIGIRMGYHLQGTAFDESPNSADWVTPTGTKTVSFGPATATWSAQWRYQLVATGGPIATGAVSVPALTVKVNLDNNFFLHYLTATGTGPKTTATTCTARNTALVVPMPQGRVNAMPTVGSTTGDTTFNMTFDCSAATSLYVTFTDASQPGNTSSNLSLATGSTASGVAYQIVSGGNAVSFGPDSSVAGNLNQVNLNTAVGGAGSVTIPFTARYVRTGTIAPGTANAQATFTMSYQ